MNPKAGFLAASVLFSILATAPVRAESAPLIEVDEAPTLDAAKLLESKGFRQHREAVISEARRKIDQDPAMDETIKQTLRASLEEILAGRILDVQAAFLTGFPDLAAICLEGHPVRHVAIEACASTAVIVSAVVIAAKYRWDLLVKQTASGRVHQLSAGPGFGTHIFFGTSWMGGNADAVPDSASIDAIGSLEYVYWISRHFGFTTQLDLGPSLVINTALGSGISATPMGRLTFGLAF